MVSARDCRPRQRARPSVASLSFSHIAVLGYLFSKSVAAVSDDKPALRGKDQRRAERRLGNIGALIILANGDQMRCVVKDFSKTGALLIVSSVLGLPNEFELQAIGGPRRSVRVVRRGSGKVAVRFV
jgi:hypothetical protein